MSDLNKMGEMARKNWFLMANNNSDRLIEPLLTESGQANDTPECDYQAVTAFEIDDKPHYQSRRRMEKGKAYRQFMVAIIANISSFAVGTALGWTSPVNPKLENPLLVDSPLPAVPTKDEAAWIGSLVALSAFIAPFAAGPLADIIGRKWTLMSSSVFYALSYILLVTAHSVGQMYAARLIQGLGVGFVMTVAPMYVGEISTDASRGALGSLMQLFIVSGILYVYIVGPYVSYYAMQYFCLAVPIVFAGLFFLMPESPYWYIAKGRKEEAINALRFVRGKSAEGVQDEMTSIQVSVEESMRNKGSFMDVFSTKGNVKALCIGSGLVAFQQLSGINVILFYSTSIFQKTGSDLEPAVATILVGVVQVLASGCTPLIADRLGKKLILLMSAAGMGLSLGTMGLYFYLDLTDKSAAQSVTWLPIASLIVFVIMYCIGFGPLPWAVMGEIFPANIKSVASSIVASTCWVLGFLVTRFFSSVDEAVGSHWAFWIFAILCAFAFAFTFTVVMETKGMSLQQIQDMLNGTK